MENQHRQIKGYRELSQEEIDLMNEIKTKAAECGELVAKLFAAGTTQDNAPDGRWLSIGKADLQTGFMALVRAIAKPESF